MKKNFYFVFFTAIFFLGTSSNIKAQMGGIYFSLAFPMEEFSDNLQTFGGGLSGELFFVSPKPHNPIGIGISGAYYIYGSETRREPWSFTIPDVFVDVERTNNLANFHLIFTLAPPVGNVRPYIEALLGGSYLFTETSVRGTRNDEEIASSTNFEDWAWSYGFGGGLAFRVGENIFIDLKARYLWGSEAEYLKEGAVQVIGRTVYYDLSQSRTDILSAHLGVRFYFNWRNEN